MAGHRFHLEVKWLGMERELHFKTERVSVFGEAPLRAVCDQLIEWSQWFIVMPMPDDEWEVEVKVENVERVRSWAQATSTN